MLDGATGGGNKSVNLSALAVADLTAWVARLGANDVKVNSANVAVAVSWLVWGKLLTIQEFVNSQWVGPDMLPLAQTGFQGKVWAGAIWFPTSALTVSTTSRKCYAWARDAVGHGIGEDVNTEVNYIPTKRSYFANSSMTQGAVLIDDSGVERVTIDEGA